MIKKSSLFVLVIAILFMLSWDVSVAAQQDEQNLEQKIAQLKEKIKELAVKIERNPDAEKANEWRETRRKYINELEMIQEREQKLKAQLERRKRGADLPSAYQRERGELTAYVISATSEDVTVRLKDSGKVMVLRVPQMRRVERRRVPNTDMIKMVKKLKKNQLIWARYNEGEERGTYFIQEIKKIKEDK